jgi:hypothetical protein
MNYLLNNKGVRKPIIAEIALGGGEIEAFIHANISAEKSIYLAPNSV